MTTLKDLKKVLENYDENLDIKLRIRPIYIGESVDGHEPGDFEVKQETFISVTYYAPAINRNEIVKNREWKMKK